MSGGLAPSKSTIYVSNFDYALTNSDVYQIFEQYGQIGKVTIVRDRETRESKGVAFVLFVKREDALRAIAGVNGLEMNGRTLKASIAKDNGRAREFIKRKTYKDKTRCYECGDSGHVSYDCPKNTLGPRPKPVKKKKKKKDGRPGSPGDEDSMGSDSDDYSPPPVKILRSSSPPHPSQSLPDHLARPRTRADLPAASSLVFGAASSGTDGASAAPTVRNPLAKPKPKKASGYFSDEEDRSD